MRKPSSGINHHQEITPSSGITNAGWKTKSYFWNMIFHNAETHHGNALQILFVARTTTPKSLKEAGFVFLHKFVCIVSRVDWCVWVWLNVRISLLEKESVTGSTLRSQEQSMEHKDATITFGRRCS